MFALAPSAGPATPSAAAAATVATNAFAYFATPFTAVSLVAVVASVFQDGAAAGSLPGRYRVFFVRLNNSSPVMPSDELDAYVADRGLPDGSRSPAPRCRRRPSDEPVGSCEHRER